MEELKLKEKHELIQIALEILKDKQSSLVITPEDYESSAWNNSKEIIVKFRRIIRYIPLGTDPEKYFSYDVKVNLNTNKISPFDEDAFFRSEFYVESDEDKKSIEFVKKNFVVSASFKNTVYESKESYFIDCQNQYSFGKYLLNKTTGEVKPEIQASYEPMIKPNRVEDLDVFTEIK